MRRRSPGTDCTLKRERDLESWLTGMRSASKRRMDGGEANCAGLLRCLENKRRKWIFLHVARKPRRGSDLKGADKVLLDRRELLLLKMTKVKVSRTDWNGDPANRNVGEAGSYKFANLISLGTSRYQVSERKWGQTLADARRSQGKGSKGRLGRRDMRHLI